jgi:hypothetical protein
MSEELKIESIQPVPKKRGRPAGSKNKPASRKPRVYKATPKMRNPKKVDGFAIGVCAQHYWLISALAEARKVTRHEVLEGIINKYIASIGA